MSHATHLAEIVRLARAYDAALRAPVQSQPSLHVLAAVAAEVAEPPPPSSAGASQPGQTAPPAGASSPRQIASPPRSPLRTGAAVPPAQAVPLEQQRPHDAAPHSVPSMPRVFDALHAPSLPERGGATPVPGPRPPSVQNTAPSVPASADRAAPCTHAASVVPEIREARQIFATAPGNSFRNYSVAEIAQLCLLLPMPSDRVTASRWQTVVEQYNAWAKATGHSKRGPHSLRRAHMCVADTANRVWC